MKRLAILSSLALIVAPTFSGNGVSDLAKNQIRFAEETGGATDTSSNPTITFGSETADTNSTNYSDTATSSPTYTLSNADFTLKSISAENCFEHKTAPSESPLKVSSKNNAGKITMNFSTALTIESVTIRAKASNNTANGAQLKVTIGEKTVSTKTGKTSDGFGDCLFSGFTGSSNSIVIEGAKGKTNVLYISTVSLKLTSTKTVTYDYGDYKDDSWKTNDSVDAGSTITAPVAVGTTYGTDWYENPTLTAWLKDDGTAFDFSKDTVSEDITLHAKWETKKTEAVANVESSETKAQLYYEYTVTEDASTNDKTYSISNINLRFGGLIKKEYYDALEEHIKSVGMIYTTELPSGYETIKAAAEANALNENNAKILTNDVATRKPVLTDDEAYYLYNVCLDVKETALKTTVYAIASITFDNDKTVYFSDKTESVSSIAKEYQDLYEDNEEILATLMLLEEGYVEGSL